VHNEKLSTQTRHSESISIFGDGKVSAVCFAESVARLKRAYPKLDKGFYLTLNEMVDKNGFTDERLVAAIDEVISTCEYPDFPPARILNFDKRVKVHSLNELHQKFSETYIRDSKSGEVAYIRGKDIIKDEYEEIEFYGQKRFIKKEDAVRLKLKK
jgi:predicted DNA-binding ribbon-helix-helix protein